MISIIDLLTEETAIIYKGLIRVTYTEDVTVSEVADVVRALEGVTIVTSTGGDERNRIAIFTIKIRTTAVGENAGITAFKQVRQDAIGKQEIAKFEIGTQTIERVN